MSDRMTRRRYTQLTGEQKTAYDLIMYGHPTPAQRARCKLALGRRPSRAERLALAHELLATGLTRLEVAARIGIEVGSLDRALRESETAEIGPKKPLVSRGFGGRSDPSKMIASPRHRPTYGGDQWGYDFDAAIEAAP